MGNVRELCKLHRPHAQMKQSVSIAKRATVQTSRKREKDILKMKYTKKKISQKQRK